VPAQDYKALEDKEAEAAAGPLPDKKKPEEENVAVRAHDYKAEATAA
jgi:hypothetical protein